jgi:probable HAF family extracellular repeat protein
MKCRWLFTHSVAALSALLAMPIGAIAQQAFERHGKHFNRYTVTDLGVLGEGTNSAAFDMNSEGWVGGSSNLTPGGPQHAFLWYGGGPLQDLGTLGGPNSAADGPNLFGEAPIISEIAEKDPDGEDFCGYGTHLQCRGAIWRFGRLTVLRGLPGGRNSVPIGINNLGQLIGWAETGVRDSTCASATRFQVYRFEAVKWEPNGEIEKLRPLTEMGDTVAYSFGINDRGQAVGSSGTCATQGLPSANITGLHAVRWERDGSPTYLGTLGDAHNTKSNIASSITERGMVVGTSQYIDGTIHAFLWRKATGMRDIGTLPGAFATIAPCCHSINNRGDVVGFSIDGKGPTAFLWRDNVIRDLNSLIPANSPLHLLFAQTINDEGEIVGQGCVLPECTVLHAFRATPRRTRR